MKKEILFIQKKIEILEEELKTSKNKKDVRKLLKEEYKKLKVLYKDCSKKGHDFGEWEDISIIEEKPYYEPYLIHQGYYMVTFPLYKRTCKECGAEEFSRERINKEKKKSL